jgi:hypothetical protein
VSLRRGRRLQNQLDHDAEKWEPVFGLHHGPT